MMMIGKSCSLVVLVLLLMIHSSLSLTKCKKHELEALLKFKHSFTRDSQRLLSSWVGDNCCHWRGVTCDDVTSDVIKLSLGNPGDDTTSLVSSKLSSALLELRFLSHLDLSANNFSGSRIPGFVGSMTNLRYLNFAGALFSAPFPPQIGNLTNLIHLDLSDLGNGYFTLKTEERLEWASSLSNLRYLDMSLIDMSQAYDSLQVLFRLPSLSVLSLSNCWLSNTHLSQLHTTNTSSLKYLDLSSNKLEGSFPTFLKNMPCLKSLSLNFNSFSGDVPIWFGNMKHLKQLHLNSNKFSGRLPSQLGQLTNLNDLYLSDNELHGPVPTSIAKLTALKHLDLSNNRLSGLIPDVLGPLTELETLDLSSNSIHGTISHIGNLSKLSTLNMNFNNIKLNLGTNWRPPFQLEFLGLHSCQLNTAFPQWLRNQTQITSLDLSYTGISGEIPQWLWNLTTLNEWVLGGNKLTGSLPRHITCDGCGLTWIDVHSNMLSGTIPHWLKHLRTVWLLDLSENLLSGRIFETRNGSSLLSGTNHLTFLDLSNNMFSGEIQVKNGFSPYFEFLSLRGNDFSGLINSQLCNFTSLSILELAHNRFTGHIPQCLGSIRFESGSGYDSSTSLDTQEIIKGTTENFPGTVNAHSMIDLSCNLLTGTIPEELTNITNLMQLNLSNNHLTGGIPDDIGNLQLLESLDLSSNNLSGEIPQSLSHIPWLSVLNLSYNDLYGPIPTGRQLQSLADPSIYAGNSGLCGFPLPNKCTNSNPPPNPTDDNHGGEEDDDSGDKHDKLWIFLAVMYGVATGFWGVVGTLVLKKRWRHAYFRFVEKTADRIYVPFKVRMNRFKTENSG